MQDAHQQIKRGEKLLFWYLLLDKSSVTDTVIPSFKWQYKNTIEKEIKFSIPITKVSFMILSLQFTLRTPDTSKCPEGLPQCYPLSLGWGTVTASWLKSIACFEQLKTVNTMFDLDAHSNSYLVCVFMTQRSHFSTMRQQSMQFKKYGVVLNMGSRNRMFLSCVNSEKLLNLSVHRRRARGSYLRGMPRKLHESTAGVWEGGGEWHSLSETSIYDLQKGRKIFPGNTST